MWENLPPPPPPYCYLENPVMSVQLQNGDSYKYWMWLSGNQVWSNWSTNGVIPYRYKTISVFNSLGINLSIPSYFPWIIWKITGNQKNLKHFGHFSWVHQLIPSPEPNLKNYGSIRYWPKRYFSWKNGTKSFNNPYSIPSLCVLHQNKFLHNFHKRRQHLIVGHIKGLY